MELDTTSHLASRALASAWLEAGNFDEARKVLNRALATHESPEFYELEARADEGSGLFQKAAEDYRRATALSATEGNSFGIGYELLLSGALVDASEAFAEGMLRYPNSILMQIGAGTAHFLRGDNAAALSAFLAAAEADPADQRPYSFLSASTALSSNQRNRALTAFKRYLNREPNSADANYFYAVALARNHSAGDTTRTQTLLRRAIELNPGLAKAHLQMAESYAQTESSRMQFPSTKPRSVSIPIPDHTTASPWPSNISAALTNMHARCNCSASPVKPTGIPTQLPASILRSS